MQIRHQLIAMLTLPLLFLFISVGLLSYSYGRVDMLVARELKAKQSISLALQLRSKMERIAISMTGQRFTGSKDLSSSSKEQINKYFASLKTLAANDTKTLELLKRLHMRELTFLEIGDELTTGYKSGDGSKLLYFSRFMSRKELLESLKYSFQKINEDIAVLIARYAPVARELNPESVQARSHLVLVSYAAVIGNIALVAFLAISLNRNTLDRMKVLTGNMLAFAEGNRTGKRLSGNDELSLLDSAFQNMADELFRLEDLKNSLRAMVSHDLRSPLTSMILKLELILDMGGDLEPEVQTKLKRLLAETNNLRRLANTVLDIEKLEDGKLEISTEVVSIESICNSALESIDELCKLNDIQISLEIDKSSYIYCDKDRTCQSLINLLSNSLKFAPQGSQVIVKTQRTQEDSLWRISVIDDGPGVPESERPKLFSKFCKIENAVTGKQDSGSGTGLGLYMVKALIEVQKGKVSYQPGMEGGSIFSFELPAASPPEIEPDAED